MPQDLGRAVRLGVLIGLWVGGLWLATTATTYYIAGGGVGQDAHAYWLTAHRPALYGPAPGTRDAFLYSPAFAQVIRPLALLPWSAFLSVWMVAEAAAFVWLVQPCGWRWGVPLLLLCVPELLVGNVVGLVAVAVVVGMTRPGAWVVPLLTKVSLAGVGAVWFAVRGEWRQMLEAAAWTVGVVGVSAATWPRAWAAWLALLTGSASGPALPLRVALALLVLAAGARRGWTWAIPCALVAVAPVLNASQPLAYLLAVIRLRQVPVGRRDQAFARRMAVEECSDASGHHGSRR